MENLLSSIVQAGPKDVKWDQGQLSCWWLLVQGMPTHTLSWMVPTHC